MEKEIGELSLTELITRIERILYEKPGVGQDFYRWAGPFWEELKNRISSISKSQHEQIVRFIDGISQE